MHRVLWIACCLMFPCVATAEMSPELAAWIDGPAAVIMTPAERSAAARITSDRDMYEFISVFWARRDPDPATRANEFRHDFEARVRAADRQFGFGSERGALTDRGRTLILLGLPSERRTGRIEPYLRSLYREQLPEDGIQRNRRIGEEGDMAYRMRFRDGLPQEGPDAGIESKARREGKISEEVADHGIRYDRSGGRVDVWIYTLEQLPWIEPTGPDAESVRVNFFDHFATGEFLFEPKIRHGQLAVEAFQATPEASIRHPEITTPPVYPLIEGEPKASPTQLALLDKNDPTWSALATARIARGVRSLGDYPAWLFVCLPPEAPSATTIFGRMVDGHGLVQGTFQVEASPRRCRHGAAYELSMPVFGSDVVVELMLAGDAGPIAGHRVAVNPAPAIDSEPFITPVLAGAELDRLTAFDPGDPFVYGGHRLTPRPTGRYSEGERLTYFSLVAAPGLEENGQPNVWVALQVYRAGSSTPLFATPKRPAPLSAVSPGVYMIGSELPLDALPNGTSFRLQVTVADAVSGLQRSSSIPFTLE